MRKLSFVLMILAGAVWPVSAQHSAPQSAEQSTKPAEQVFKNIQIFKGIPGEQILPTMQFIANSLGVECEFCVRPADKIGGHEVLQVIGPQPGQASAAPVL